MEILNNNIEIVTAVIAIIIAALAGKKIVAMKRVMVLFAKLAERPEFAAIKRLMAAQTADEQPSVADELDKIVNEVDPEKKPENKAKTIGKLALRLVSGIVFKKFG